MDEHQLSRVFTDYLAPSSNFNTSTLHKHGVWNPCYKLEGFSQPATGVATYQLLSKGYSAEKVLAINCLVGTKALDWIQLTFNSNDKKPVSKAVCVVARIYYLNM